jgi:hypothetical protein
LQVPQSKRPEQKLRLMAHLIVSQGVGHLELSILHALKRSPHSSGITPG